MSETIDFNFKSKIRKYRNFNNRNKHKDSKKNNDVKKNVFEQINSIVPKIICKSITFKKCLKNMPFITEIIDFEMEDFKYLKADIMVIDCESVNEFCRYILKSASELAKTEAEKCHYEELFDSSSFNNESSDSSFNDQLLEALKPSFRKHFPKIKALHFGIQLYILDDSFTDYGECEQLVCDPFNYEIEDVKCVL